MIDRRRFLGAATALGAAGLFAPRIYMAWASEDLIVLTAEEINLSLAEGEMPESPFWLYNGRTPGPEIRVRKGDTVRVKLVNKLPEPTSIHWHGIRIVNAMDGVYGLTQKAVEPGLWRYNQNCFESASCQRNSDVAPASVGAKELADSR